jgi:hypothetical protein
MRQIGHSNFISRNIEKLLHTSQVVDMFAESQEEFVRFRIEHARAAFEKEGRCPTLYQLKSRAAIPTSMSSLALEEALSKALET